MTNEPREPENEQAFEQDLEAVQTEWSRMEQAEPPELLDQAVLNAARRDLEPRWKIRPMSWLGGFATAAVVVLAITITLEQQGPQTPEPTLEDIGQLKRDAASTPELEESTTMKAQHAPLPAAEPRAQTREAKRQKQAISITPAAKEGNNAKIKINPPAFDASQFNMTPGAPAKAGPDTAELSETATDAEDEPDQSQAPRDAEDWIQHLLLLREIGHMKGLAGELAAFRHYYPEYPLPEELAELEP